MTAAIFDNMKRKKKTGLIEGIIAIPFVILTFGSFLFAVLGDNAPILRDWILPVVCSGKFIDYTHSDNIYCLQGGAKTNVTFSYYLACILFYGVAALLSLLLLFVLFDLVNKARKLWKQSSY